jgi:hypothetical protein
MLLPSVGVFSGAPLSLLPMESAEELPGSSDLLHPVSDIISANVADSADFNNVCEYIETSMFYDCFIALKRLHIFYHGVSKISSGFVKLIYKQSPKGKILILFGKKVPLK